MAPARADPDEPPAKIPRCPCGGRIRPHICWFGEVPYELDRIFAAWIEEQPKVTLAGCVRTGREEYFR